MQRRFDTIYCMEVFEHVVDPAPILDRLHRLLVPGGALVISVPIETGLPLIVKQIVRTVAGWRGIGHYPGTTGYTPMELLRSVFAGSSQHITRPVFSHQDGSTFHDHKGFNWRVLRSLIAARFELIRQTTSPVGALGPQLGTQRWFIARKTT
jgi:predicted SAM-dependent methyltransferase